MARTTIPAELVAVNAIQGTLIADNAITAVHIATNAVSGTLVADNSITSTHIAKNNVTATQIAQNTITVTQLADSAVETAKLNNDAVTQAKIADDAVGADQLAANSVVSASIVNGSIVEADMADNAVTLAKMASLARGSIIVGDSAGDPSALSIGSNTYVLTSDGTDISWAAASGGVDGISSSADATAMTIDSNENVGIGTTSPNHYANYKTLTIDSPGSGSGAVIDLEYRTTRSLSMFSESGGSTIREIRNSGLNFGANNTNYMTINGTGRVGIGTTTTNAGLTVANADIRCTGAAVLNDANSISMSQESSGGFITARGPSTSERGVLGLSVNRSNGAAGIVAIRINNGGSINYGGHTGEATGSTGGITMSVDNNDRMNLICATTGTGNLELIEFRNPNGTVGDIKSNGTSTSYNTSSDYRLKENINYTWDATTRLKQLKPARFNFKTDTDKTLDGFLAHEVSSIVPEAISGEKDGEKMQSIDQSKLVPLLVKALQEADDKIDALTTRVATLEG